MQDFNSVVENLKSRQIPTEMLTPAKGNTFVCIDENCKNGSGDDGTGAILSDDGTRLLCGKCGKGFSYIDVAAAYYNIDLSNFVEGVKGLCRIEGIQLDSKPVAQDYKSTKKEKSLSPELQALILADIEKSKERADKIPEREKRGLSDETLAEFKIGVDFQWTPPQNRLDNEKSYLSPRVIIPHLTNSALPDIKLTYCAALFLVERERLETNGNKVLKYLYGGSRTIFGLNTLTPNAELIIFVEGEFDALSIWQATGGKYPCLATGGTANNGAFQTLDKFYSNKPKILFVGDNDIAGKDFAEKFCADAIKAGFAAVPVYLAEFDAEKLDANKILIEQGNAKLAEMIDFLISNAQEDLARAADEVQSYKEKALSQKFNTEQMKELELPAKLRDEVFNQIVGISDLANARRIAALFGKDCRYVADVDRWAHYRGEVWNIASDKNSEMFPLVIKVADILAANSKTNYEKAVAAAFTSHKKISPSISILKGVERIRIRTEDFDRHKNLINCLNGVVDVETGKFYPHSEESQRLLITQKANANFRPNYTNEIVENFLHSIQPDAETLNALLRFIGYGFTGETRSEKFLMMLGRGGNGKGTLTSLILKVAGNYGVSIPIKVILLGGSNDANAATPALSILEKKRIAISEEIPKGAKVDAATLKLLTGRDSLYVRNLHQEGRIIQDPTWTLILSGNNPLELQDANDTGIIRRLINLQFSQDFTGANCDETLKDKLYLQDSLDGFFSRIVAAAGDWYREGLIISSEMKNATQDYLNSQDFVGEFIFEHCKVGDSFSIPRKEFLKALQDEYPKETRGLSDRALTSMIEKVAGISYRRGTGGGYAFFGIAWNDSPEQQNLGFNDDGETSDVDVPF